MTIDAVYLLQLTLNGIFAGCVLVFVLSLGFYVTPALLEQYLVMLALWDHQKVPSDPRAGHPCRSSRSPWHCS